MRPGDAEHGRSFDPSARRVRPAPAAPIDQALPFTLQPHPGAAPTASSPLPPGATMLPKPTFAPVDSRVADSGRDELPLAMPIVGAPSGGSSDTTVAWPSENEWRGDGPGSGQANNTSTPNGDDSTSATDSKALLAGGSVLAVAMFAANGGNYLLNVVLGRWLTPPEFADANLMVTLMLLVTAIAVSLQLIAARFAGIHAVSGTAEQTRAMARSLERSAAIGGIGFAALLAGGAPLWADFFNVQSAWPFVILGLGMPAYLVQAVGRGVLQGQLEFRKLAGTFVQEMIVRVVLGIALVWAGFGVIGATAALTASFIATWLAVKLALGWKPTRGEAREKISKEVLAYAGPVGILLLGQIIINNGDVLISKQGLEPTEAGVYAAVALVGRAVFFLSWSVATTLFPAAAQREEAGEESNGLLYAGLAAVAVLGVCAVIGARLLGGTVLGRVFGDAYAGVSNQLALYALATAVFAMANLIVSHYLALGQLREALIMLVGGGVQTTLLLLADKSIDALIQAQVIAMFILFAAVFISHGARSFSVAPLARGATSS